jgi:hypothetical protein
MLCIFYGLVALGALIATWSQNIAHFMDGRSFPLQYLQDLKVTAAARSFAVDLGFLLLAVTALMVAEARRLGIRFVWLYVVFAFAIAISFTFPLFLIARELRLAKTDSAPSAVKLRAGDILGLALTTLLVLGMCIFILT